MKIFFIILFTIALLLTVSSCTPVTIGTAATNPIKIDATDTESISAIAGEIIYVQSELPSQAFSFRLSKTRELDDWLKPRDFSGDGDEDEYGDWGIVEGEVFITKKASSWFQLTNHQVFSYNSDNEALILAKNENWNLKLKETKIRREVVQVDYKRKGGTGKWYIKYHEWVEFVFEVTPDIQAQGEYLVLATIKQEDEIANTALKLKVKAQNLVKQNLGVFAVMVGRGITSPTANAKPCMTLSRRTSIFTNKCTQYPI